MRHNCNSATTMRRRRTASPSLPSLDYCRALTHETTTRRHDATRQSDHEPPAGPLDGGGPCPSLSGLSSTPSRTHSGRCNADAFGCASPSCVLRVFLSPFFAFSCFSFSCCITRAKSRNTPELHLNVHLRTTSMTCTEKEKQTHSLVCLVCMEMDVHVPHATTERIIHCEDFFTPTIANEVEKTSCV